MTKQKLTAERDRLRLLLLDCYCLLHADDCQQVLPEGYRMKKWWDLLPLLRAEFGVKREEPAA